MLLINGDDVAAVFDAWRRRTSTYLNGPRGSVGLTAAHTYTVRAYSCRLDIVRDTYARG